MKMSLIQRIDRQPGKDVGKTLGIPEDLEHCQNIRLSIFFFFFFAKSEHLPPRESPDIPKRAEYPPRSREFSGMPVTAKHFQPRESRKNLVRILEWAEKLAVPMTDPTVASSLTKNVSADPPPFRKHRSSAKIKSNQFNQFNQSINTSIGQANSPESAKESFPVFKRPQRILITVQQCWKNPFK